MKLIKIKQPLQYTAIACVALVTMLLAFTPSGQATTINHITGVIDNQATDAYGKPVKLTLASYGLDKHEVAITSTKSVMVSDGIFTNSPIKSILGGGPQVAFRAQNSQYEIKDGKLGVADPRGWVSYRFGTFRLLTNFGNNSCRVVHAVQYTCVANTTGDAHDQTVTYTISKK